jgi:peptide/nickel transport system substrate-binding protein
MYWCIPSGELRRVLFKRGETAKSLVGLATAFVLFFGLSPLAAAATPVDTLVMAKAMGEILSMDPAEAAEYTSVEVGASVYDRLVRFNAGAYDRLAGGVAESWEISADGKTFTFHIRKGLLFHSGNPVTADDVAFSLQRTVILNKGQAFIITQFGWTADNVKDVVKAVDPLTLQVKVVENLAPTLVLHALATGNGAAVDKKLVLAHEQNGDLGNGWLRVGNDAGSGPFILKSWKPSESIELEASPTWRLGAPALKRIIIRHIAESTTQELLLEKGDVDIARNLGPDQIRSLGANKDISVDSFPSGDQYYIAMSVREDPLAKPKVWEALRYLVDYQGIADTILKGQMTVRQSLWPEGFWASVTDNPFKLDVSKAKQLLAEAGYPNGFEVQLNIPNIAPYTQIAQAIQQTMAQAGVKLSVVTVEQKEFITIYRGRKKFQMVIYLWNPDYMDPSSNIDPFAVNLDNSDSSTNHSPGWRVSWQNPELVPLAKAADLELNEDKRKAQYEDLQRRLMQSSPYIMMFQANTLAARRNNVKGFQVGPIYDIIYYDSIVKN